jgi:hypothetical protein
MKFFTQVIFLQFLVHFCNSDSIFKATVIRNSKASAISIADVISEYFVRQNISYEIIIFGAKTKEIDDVLDEILRTGRLFTKIRQISSEQPKNVILEESAVVFGDAKYMKTFNNITKVVTKFPKKIKLLIYTHNISDFFVVNYLTAGFPKNGQFEYFLQDSGNFIKLQTFEWFDTKFCNKKTIKTLNIFSKKSKTWIKPLKNHEKYKNMHGCMISAIVGPSEYYNKLHGKLSDFGFDIMDVVGHRGNFTVHRESWNVTENIKYLKNVSYIYSQVLAKTDNIAIFPRMGLHYLKTISDVANNFVITPGIFN